MKLRLLLLSTIGMLLSCVALHAQTHLFPETDVVNVTNVGSMSQWQATPTVAGSSLNVSFQNDANTNGPAIWMNASSADWTGAQAFVVDLSNLSPDSIGLTFQIFDAPGDNGTSVWVGGSLDRGESTIWSINLNSNAAIYGMNVPPPLVIGPGVTSNGAGWPAGFGITHIDHIKVQASYSGAGSPTINLRSMRISKPATEVAMYTGLMDQFGQYAQGSWLNKITSTSDLAARLSAENADLAAHPVSADWDSYGGWATGPTITSATSGFFSTAQYNGKWWLVTPGGHLFWYTSFQDMNPSYFQVGLSTREYMMAAQPPGGPYSAYDFFAANVNQKYAGSPSADGSGPWRTQMIKRLKSWGINSIGEFSDTGLMNLHQAPYAIQMFGMPGSNYVLVSDGVDGGSVYDPFVDGFSTTVASDLTSQFNPTTVNDPWCVGYYEPGPGEVGWGAGWVNGQVYMARYGLAVTVLNNPPAYSTTGNTNCAKKQFVTDLTTEYGTIDSLNAAWGTSFGSWSALLSATNWVTTSPTTPNATMTTDMGAFITHLTSAYFQVLYQTIKANDPNHLVLGPHFGCPTPEIVAGAKNWMDVISYDPPGGGPSLFNSSMYTSINIANSGNKPWIVGSWEVGTTDSGMFSGWGGNAKNRQDCGNLYQKFVNILLASPVFVGTEFYRFSDESLIGDPGWSENLQEGFVDFCDTPYYPLINAARAVHATMYRQHGYTGSPRNIDSNGLSTAIVPGLVEAETYDSGSNGVACKSTPTTEACSDTGGGLDLTGISAGDFWSYTINAVPAGQYTVGLRVAASSSGASLHIEDINGVNLSGPISIPATGSGQTWETVNATVSLTGGSQTIRVVADNAGFNFNNLSFYWMPYEGDFTIMNVNSSMFVAPVPYSTQGSGIVLALPDNAADQRWHLTPTGGGYYTISSNDRTLNLAPATNNWGWWYPAAGGTAPGDSITEWAASPAWYEQWQLVPSGFAGYQLVNRSNGLALDVSGSSTTAGTGLVQQTVSTGTSQVWIFAYVPGVAYMPVPQAVANPYAPPAAPTGLTATGSNGAVTLGWTVASGTGCNVKRSLTSGSGYVTIASGVTTSFYTDNSVTNGSAYYYVVSALNASGESANSTEACATPVAPPAAPAGLGATGGNGTVTLNWTAPAGAVNYNVQRSVTSGNGYSTIASGVTSATYADNSVSNGTTYYYLVSAANPGGTSPNSTEASAMPVGTGSLPSPWKKVDVGSPSLTGTSIYDGGSTFLVKGAGGGIGGSSDQFQFAYVTTISTGFSVIARVTVPPTGTTQVGLMIRSGTTNSAKFAAVILEPNGTGYKAQFGSRTSTSGTWSVATTGLAVPQWLKLTRASNLYTGYVSSDGQTWTSVGSRNSSSIIGSGTAYCGLVVSSSNTGVLAAESFDNVSISAAGVWTAPPGAPSGLTAAAASQTQMNLAWTAVSGATGYQVLRSNSWSGIYSQVGTTLATSYSDTGLTAGTYYYMVNATSSSGTSGNSTVVEGTTYPATPSGLMATGSNSVVALSWGASGGATSYNIKRSLTSGSGYATLVTGVVTGTTYNDNGVSNGTTYYYVVSAVNPGGESANSTEASATPVAPPVITSASSMTGTNGSGFSYLIAGSNNPTGFSATLLPAGLGVNADTGLISGTPTVTGTTNVTINASNAGGTGSATLVITVLPAPPAAPGGINATGGNQQVFLSWNPSPGATGYNVKRSGVSGSNYVTIMSNTPATSYTDIGVTNWTTYYYVVSALNAGGESANSAQAAAQPQSPPISTAEKNASSSISLSGSNTALTFKSSVTGHTYQLQYVDSLTSGTWTNYGTAQPGNGGNLIFPAPYDNTVPRRFYRLQIWQ